MGRDCEAPPVADEASRLAAAATQQLPSEQRLAKEMLMLQRGLMKVLNYVEIGKRGARKNLLFSYHINFGV